MSPLPQYTERESEDKRNAKESGKHETKKSPRRRGWGRDEAEFAHREGRTERRWRRGERGKRLGFGTERRRCEERGGGATEMRRREAQAGGRPWLEGDKVVYERNVGIPLYPQISSAYFATTRRVLSTKNLRIRIESLNKSYWFFRCGVLLEFIQANLSRN